MLLKMVIVVLFLLGGGQAVGGAPAAEERGEVVVVTLLPHRQWVRELLGEPAFPVEVLVPPGHNPATYGLLPTQMRALARARGYLVNGHLPFERRWLPEIRARFSRLPVADLSEGLALLQIEGHHHHGEEPAGSGHGDPHRESVDPHFWLSPRQALLQVRRMAGVLSDWFPERKERIEINLRGLQERMLQVQGRMQAALAPHRGATLLVFHPSWGYFCQEFGLRQVAIEQEGKSPGGRDLAHIVADARSNPVRAVVVQKQFDTRSAQAVARALGTGVLVLNPLEENWLEEMPRIAQALAAEALRR